MQNTPSLVCLHFQQKNMVYLPPVCVLYCFIIMHNKCKKVTVGKQLHVHVHAHVTCTCYMSEEDTLDHERPATRDRFPLFSSFLSLFFSPSFSLLFLFLFSSLSLLFSLLFLLIFFFSAFFSVSLLFLFFYLFFLRSI